MIVQKSFYHSDFVNVKNWFLGENYENFAWNDANNKRDYLLNDRL